MKNETIVKNYLDCFNANNRQGMIDLLSPSVKHFINQGSLEVGTEKFEKFLNHMDHCYEEKLVDVTILGSADSNKVAAEFRVLGTYLKTDGTLPAAKGQKYDIWASGFYEISDGKISSIKVYYNLPEWIQVVSR